MQSEYEFPHRKQNSVVIQFLLAHPVGYESAAMNDCICECFPIIRCSPTTSIVDVEQKFAKTLLHVLNKGIGATTLWDPWDASPPTFKDVGTKIICPPRPQLLQVAVFVALGL